MRGFSESNLKYARRLAEAWPSEELVRQQPVGELPWSHTIQLLDKPDDQRLRDRSAAQDAHHGWSRAVLEHQVVTVCTTAPSNFSSVLERGGSDPTQQLTKDPYALDFLAIDLNSSERELEERLTLCIVETIRELGAGFSFVGKQVHFIACS